jgi:hypothetical protein
MRCLAAGVGPRMEPAVLKFLPPPSTPRVFPELREPRLAALGRSASTPRPGRASSRWETARRGVSLQSPRARPHPVKGAVRGRRQPNADGKQLAAVFRIKPLRRLHCCGLTVCGCGEGERLANGNSLGCILRGFRSWSSAYCYYVRVETQTFGGKRRKALAIPLCGQVVDCYALSVYVAQLPQGLKERREPCGLQRTRIEGKKTKPRHPFRLLRLRAGRQCRRGTKHAQKFTSPHVSLPRVSHCALALFDHAMPGY